MEGVLIRSREDSSIESDGMDTPSTAPSMDPEVARQLAAENHRLRDELARMNRISVMEAMSSSISHEINQPIGSALNFAQAARRWLLRNPASPDEALSAIDGAIEEIRRAGEVVSAIRRIVGRCPSALTETDIGRHVESIIWLVNAELALHDVSLRFTPVPASESLMAIARADEITQVIMNLVRNSLEAFPDDHTDRIIGISVKRACHEWLDIVVTDNGPGIAAAELPHVCDSFFTTKPNGSGVGLSLCKAIAECHGGSLHVQSAPGNGTAVTFRIPAMGVRAASTQA